MTAASVLRLNAVRTSYGDRDVLRGVTLTVAPGEVHCLLGENGAGKTTLIRTVLGRVPAQAGRVETVPGGIGLVPQQIALFPGLTAAENLSIFARLAGVAKPAIAARVANVAEACGIAGCAGEIVGTLSGGWQRRVNIAAALLHRPALLILDEPTAGIDVEARATIHRLIRRLAADGIGVLMTTHDLPEAEAVCTHVALLSEGRIACAGPVAEVLRARFGGKLLLSAMPCAPLGTQQSMSAVRLGLAPAPGALTALVADEGTGLTLVAALRDAGIALRGFGIVRPGLEQLRANGARAA
ncbi:ABC transporter ATP-binding protein [Jannaschia donghaensis]|uniref:Putative ABC transporter ATP-binding protein YxlF n=1 Tax=Jannaschia donghaensis TaxID=420998 RepID=A0A0M6YGI2_9RHOB|nr:ABC transporter ATP-binding protein [Jannaschia donghaensis]CTQ49461.1 putative ABC transporter ATP-binding protein YxlF [Jannaschia donghaensis]